MISGQGAGNDRARSRIEGLQRALHAHQIDPETMPLIETPYEVDNGARAFEQLMQLDPRPTAVMCGNDVLAVGALRQARHMGMDVPNDVSITGFDDIELARIVEPALTTVQVPHREMGRKAARELVRMVERKIAGTSHKLQTQLKVRRSLGPLPE